MSGVSQPEASSTGQAHSASPWLDARYEVNRAAYEAQVSLVGFEPGWHVLDAGSGSGSFLTQLAELTGPNGQLEAFDLAPDNIAVIEERRQTWDFAPRLSTRTGSILELPYQDATFDAVWCANTTQYLSDDELTVALSELKRVVRPGGKVAVKESDSSLFRLLPGPPGIVSRTYAALARNGNDIAHGTLRGAELPQWLRSAGFVDIRRHSTLLEFSAPLNSAVRRQWRSLLDILSSQSQDLELHPEDAEFWMKLRDGENVETLLDSPDFYFCEGNTLAIGRVD